VSIPPGFTPGFDPDGNQWLYHTRFRPLDYHVGYFLTIMRAILDTTDLDDVDVMEAILDIDAADVLALTALPCPVCTTTREFDFASEVGRQLFWRIGERFPEHVSYSPELALIVLYHAIQEARQEEMQG
jgi:hypothetical protein